MDIKNYDNKRTLERIFLRKILRVRVLTRDLVCVLDRLNVPIRGVDLLSHLIDSLPKERIERGYLYNKKKLPRWIHTRGRLVNGRDTIPLEIKAVYPSTTDEKLPIIVTLRFYESASFLPYRRTRYE